MALASRKETKSTGRDGGFTLVEVMIAMVVFMVVALAVGRLSMNTWQATDCTRSYTEASVLAAQQLEGIFSQRYTCSETADANCVEDIGVLQGVTQGTKTPAADDSSYQISYTVTNDAVAPDTKSVQMNVNFMCAGVQRTVRYSYLLPMRK
jgi:Tfp pilus assembly protein PilV